ncbi:fasciclin domain-containing protein [Erythrobacteraceae bacterium CFH 75059]|uniref:fasciclin domain-containing protein n=1 Tax=Qipengyuania thermophila TaxID=2509361 RepID=UPI00101FB64F|nr:fasciclin domain-containing protein [Qipengyuania thermophila]TCD02056.1 fasciclin domain-containing protein [Erythrobacteraceae bacterium CFH 75059]
MRTRTALFAGLGALALTACGSANDTGTGTTTTTTTADTTVAGTTATATAPAASGNVVQVAQGNPDFSTLVTAVQSAGLGETLSGPGPFTVFAPTNAAFNGVPQATRDQLLSPAGREDLRSILTYHVVPGTTDAATLTQAVQAAGSGGHRLTTVNGATLTATLDGNTVVLTDAAGNRARVVQTDVNASNGVIHAIDRVLMPR